VPASTLYYYLHADGTLKAPGITLLGTGDTASGQPSPNGCPPVLV